MGQVITGDVVNTPISYEADEALNDAVRLGPLLAVQSLRKSYGDIEVLHGIDFDLRRGEVHAILGENGAGKSTLVKCLAGFEPRNGGELYVNAMQKFTDAGSASSLPASADNPVSTQSVAVREWTHGAAEAAGVVLIHQEFNLAEQLSVAENIFLGNEIRLKGVASFFLDRKQMRDLSRDYLATLHCTIDPDTLVSNLSIADKQMVEIAKTLAKDARILILDEPTAVLTQKESAALFELIDRLRERGVGIIYISHKLEEIERIADRITVIRDGDLVGCYPAADLSKDDMARLMVGRELSSLYPQVPAPSESTSASLSVSGLHVAGTLAAESFELRCGEILAFSGLVGSGRTALFETLVGLRPAKAGSCATIKVQGNEVRLGSLADARDHGVAYLTKDRKGSGLLLDKGLRENFSLFALEQFAGAIIDTRAEQSAFDKAVETFDIRMRDTGVVAGNLSGGNQQKLLLAKMLETMPDIVIIDEPTRGIDIGTKSQIYHFLAELAAAGKALVIISSDMSEVIGMAHRVAVMHQGAIAGFLSGDEITEHEIMRYATGLKAAAA
ncbi:sugar ABC transporter ATP-binding protein [Gammaproteobacteria bacterium]|nr:sugar ABC transporter ATP-binding protein [Gammaproteobacteria bacterium]